MNRLRWWIARRVAPGPIMADPYPGDGVFVVMRQGRTITAFRASTFQWSSSQQIQPFTYNPADLRYHPSRADGRFAGTVAS